MASKTTEVAAAPKTTEVAMPQQNYFEAYGNSVSNRNIVGTLLKFNKGDYLAGEDNEEIAIGTKLVAIMESLSIGWIRWDDNKPAEQIMGPVAEGYRPPKRSELGYADEEQWEVGQDGKSRDPWQFSNYLLMRMPGADPENTENLFTFATSSRGGLNAIGELSKAYGKGMRERPDEYPVVELKVDSYNHPNKEFGRIKVPVLEVVGWEPKVPEKPKKQAARKR